MILQFTKKWVIRMFVCAIALVSFAACKKDRNENPINRPDLSFTVLTNNSTLVSYNAMNLASATSTTTITGLPAGETLLAIDYRPATGQLYGISSASKIYMIRATGQATVVGTAALTPTLNGTVTAFDFNPTVDRIRVVTSSGQNLRLNPETGTVQVVDGSINGASAVISSVAYSNNKAGAATTVLFDIDVNSKKLYKQDPPNNGTLVEVGTLNIPTSSGESSFDISPSGIALAAVGSGGVSTLVQINTDNASTVVLGTIPGTVLGLAIPTEPTAYAVDEANNLIIFNPTNTTQVSKLITGLQTGETIVGIDFRPANGQLYGLGSSSRLYTFNLSSGAAVQVGTVPFTTLLTGTSFGFDFNPTVDRIRIVSNLGQNLRIDPNTGLIGVVDLTLKPGTPSISGAAYSNSFAGSTTTTLFDIDHGTDRLYRQDPPNDGVLVDLGPLGVNVESTNGFDIGGTSGTAYAILTVGSSSRVYTINLTNGTATAGVEFGKKVTAMAVGLGF